MKKTSTKLITSLFRKVNTSGASGKDFAPHRQILVVLLVLILICSNVVVSIAQATYPTLARFDKPSPEPAAPGDSFTPTMSGGAATAAPQAAEWTRTAGPDESIVLTGVDLSRYTGADAAKDTRFMVYGRNGVQREALIQRVEADKAIITLPKDIPSWSMYLIWPGNEAGYGTPMAINKTDAWWVGPDKATRGQTISVFGRNLAQNNDTLRSYVYIKPAGSAGQWAAVTRVNPYKVDFTVPAGLVNGEYEIWTHNGHGGQYGWSGPQKLTVYNGPQWTTTVFNVKNYGATGNGSTDDTEAIRKAMLAAKSSPGSTVYFPTGIYMLSNNLYAYSNIQMKGDGIDKTILRCSANYSVTTSAMGMIFGTVQNFAMSDMEFDGNRNFRDSVGKPIFLRGSKEVWITNVRFSFAGYDIMDLHQCRYVFLNKTEHIGIASFLGDGSQLFIDRNSFKLTNDTDMAMHSWSGAGISMTRSTCRDLDNSDPYNGAGWGKGRVFTGNGTWGSNRNTYLGQNVTTDLTPRPYATDQNTGEQFMWEGNLGQWAGFAGASTATTATASGYSTNNPNKQYVVIVKGRGIGQSRRIVSNNGGIITLNEPWNVIPDASSYIVIGNFIDRIAVYGNYLDGKPRAVTNPTHVAAAGIEPYGGSFNFIAANNTLHELRQGVANWSTQHYTGLDPNYFSFYANNKMINCRWGLYSQLILARPEGTAILGTTFRNNNVQSAALAGIHTAVSTSGQSSLDADVYEFNTISNSPQGLTSSVNGLSNQLFYKNNFSSVGGTGITVTPKMALRENTYQGVSALYKGSLAGTTVEAPLHVIDMTGFAGGSAATKDFIIKNSAVTAMNWIASSSASWLTFSTTNGTIPDERSVSNVILTANPAGLPAGTHTATITVTVAEQVNKYTVLLKLSAPENGVTITAPTPDKVFFSKEPVNITANATDSGAGISKVEFFTGTVKLGEDLTAPYAFNWINAVAGTYALTAKATNGAGVVITSAPVNITVSNNAAPTVSIMSPANDATFAAPASITINANAADSDGTVSKVEFFNGNTKIGEDLTSPYSISWYNVGIGSYIITARATDNTGTTTSSAPVTIHAFTATVPSVVITSPGINASIKAPTNVHIAANAELTNGVITKVEFFNGATKVGEKTAAPFEIHWMNVPTGNYSITAKAIGNTGTSTTSAPVNITIVSTTANASPTVSISSPTATSSFTAPASVTINANATDTDGTVSKVEFYYGTIKVGEDLTSPFSFTWNNVAAGTYSLTARATDNAGTTTTSAPVTITVATANSSGNVAPSVIITSPTATSVFTAPANVTINANAADTDGTVSKVEFFIGNVKVGEDFTSPYSFTWANAAAGSYSLTARATDNTGTTTTSAAVVLVIGTSTVVQAAPTVAITSPTNGLVFTAPASIIITATAADTDGTVSKVEFFNGATLVGTSTTSPYSFTWNNVAAGTYALTAKATDNSGLTATSSPVNLSVNAPVVLVAPTVIITAPATGASFTAPASVTITANAADTDGSVTKVAFFNGSVKLGEDLTSPYALDWNNIPSGNYTLTAVATDNSGLVTTSAAVQISVNAPVVLAAPTVAITSPANGTIFTAPSNITITANAADTDGNITKVEFFNGTAKIGEVTTAPYTFTWNNVAAGTYTLTAKATDNSGLVTTSAAVIITSQVNSAPTVAITSPATSASFLAIANISITATAADADGSVIKVEFYNGNTKIGEDLSSPYSISWNNVVAGNYTLTAKAYDNTSLSTVSAPVNITVNAPVPPTVALTSPATTATFMAPASITFAANASDADGTIIKVEFYQGTTKVGEDTSSPYSYTWGNVAAGTYNLTAKAYDNTGLSATSEAVTVKVNEVTLYAPAVVITAPTGTESFTAPAGIKITANATDTDGTIAKVEFYQGTTLLGTSTASPYSFIWNNVAAGTYAITVKATDNSGLSTTSAPVQVKVNAPVINCNLTLTTTQAIVPGNGGFYSVDLTIANGAAPYIYSWSNGATTEDLAKVKAGTYTVVVTDAKGCNATTTVTIQSMAYKVYPNPATTYTTFEFQADQNSSYSLDVYDTSGILVKTVQKGIARTNEIVKATWETNGTPMGIYYAKLTTKSKVETVKIVIEQ